MPRGTVPPCVGLSLECVHLCPISENLDAELSGKRIIHIAKELRFPHFFEGHVLLSECVCVCVDNFPLELKKNGVRE